MGLGNLRLLQSLSVVLIFALSLGSRCIARTVVDDEAHETSGSHHFFVDDKWIAESVGVVQLELGDFLTGTQSDQDIEFHSNPGDRYRFLSAASSCGCALVEAKESVFKEDSPFKLRFKLKFGAQEQSSSTLAIKCLFQKLSKNSDDVESVFGVEVQVKYSVSNPVSFNRDFFPVDLSGDDLVPIVIPMRLSAGIDQQALEIVSSYPGNLGPSGNTVGLV